MKLKTKSSTLSEQFQNPILKIVERGKIDSHNTQIHENHSLNVNMFL